MNRTYRDGAPHHVFSKGVDGNIVFYTRDDCLYYITLYSCYARRYGIRTLSFSLMPNHTHSFQYAPSKNVFLAFNQELISHFTTGYNNQHNRTGPVFQKPFGYAPKMVGKKIRSCISYICNNAPVGNLTDDILSYRWNLVAYIRKENPFSPKIALDHVSIRLRRSLKMVDYFRARDMPVGYETLKILFSDLNKTEKSQLIDYIVSHYEILDKRSLDEFFGSFSKAMIAMEANGGSENDIQEDWEDYSSYSSLSRIAMEEGVCLDGVNFEQMASDEIIRLANAMMVRSRATKRQIEKFLHLHPGGQHADSQ